MNGSSRKPPSVGLTNAIGIPINMSKILDLIGLALIGGTIVSFIPGLIPNMEGGLNPVFWGCAIGALAIIIYRKQQRKKQDQNLSK